MGAAAPCLPDALLVDRSTFDCVPVFGVRGLDGRIIVRRGEFALEPATGRLGLAAALGLVAADAGEELDMDMRSMLAVALGTASIGATLRLALEVPLVSGFLGCRRTRLTVGVVADPGVCGLLLLVLLV